MGTRHFIGAVIDGEMKVAQYGQWDGYLGGQGETVLAFIKAFHVTGSDHFKAQLRKCRWVTQEEIDAINKAVSSGENLRHGFPKFSRDTGADILQIVNDEASDNIAVWDRRGFVADSLFCEYAYVLDMDAERLEVYTGFNHSPLTESERFHPANWPHADKDTNQKYAPVRLAFVMPFSEAANGFTQDHRRAVGEISEDDEAA